MIAPAGPLPVAGCVVRSGPVRVGSELRWAVTTADGRPAVLGQLLPELAADESVRRRYVRDVERIAALRVEGLCPVVARGPEPDPADPSADPPWRLRLDPPGETLDAWIERRAPAPPDEVAELVAKIADCVAHLHEAGSVLRDLHPRYVVLTTDGTVWLTDVGLGRVDLLSTRTAASLMLEGSIYASPEQLRHTTLDGRSDVFGLGVILFRALTGVLPWPDAAFVREPAPPPAPSAVRGGIPPALDQLVVRCLDDDPERRPESAAEVARILRGEPAAGQRDATRVACQSCGTAMRLGQRLCLSCGKQAVQFVATAPDAPDAMYLTLKKVEEEASYLERLRAFLETVSRDALPRLNFIVGDSRMYSPKEQRERIKLPVRLFSQLTPESARKMQRTMARQGFRTEIAPHKKRPRMLSPIAHSIIGATALVTIGALVLATVPAWIIVLIASIFAVIALTIGVVQYKRMIAPGPAPLLRLRKAAAALPASDPWVTRLAELIDDQTPRDVREQLGEVALAVQRLVDHRREHVRRREEIDLAASPIAALIDLVQSQVRQLRDVDLELGDLDEGAMVRALAASEARKEPRSARSAILDGLDRLRQLETTRAAALHRLLEAVALLRRAVDLSLSVGSDAEDAHERQVALALRALGPASD